MGILSPFFIDSSNSKNNFDYFYDYCVDDYGNIYIGNEGWNKKKSPPPLDGRYAWIKKKRSQGHRTNRYNGTRSFILLLL